MKKLFTCLIAVLLVELAHATVSVNYVKTTYDESFNPTFEMEVSNTEDITLTNIVLQFTFQKEGTNMWDVLSYKYIDKNITVSVKPNCKQTIKVTIYNVDNHVYRGFSLEKARFIDGNIITR